MRLMTLVVLVVVVVTMMLKEVLKMMLVFEFSSCNSGEGMKTGKIATVMGSTTTNTATRQLRHWD